MRRWQIAALAALVPVATGAETREVSIRPRPVPVDSVLQWALATETVWVRQLREQATPAARVAADLIPRLRAILLRAHRMDFTHGAPEVCGTCADQLPIMISLGPQSAGASRLDLHVLFLEAQARYVARDGRVCQISFRDDASELLALIKRTLPGDPVVQRYAWVPRPDPPPKEPPPDWLQGSYDTEEPPEVLAKCPPQYPDDARRTHVEGTVLVFVVVDTTGRVVHARVVKSIPLLDEAAIAAVRLWFFKPGETHGRPVEMEVGIPIKFALP